MHNQKSFLEKHIKTECVMSLIVPRGYQESNPYDLTYCPIDQENIAAFCKQDFIHASVLANGRYIGVLHGGVPVAFLGIVLKGEKAAFFHVKRSDICFHNLFVFPEWRGKGVMGNAMSHCICEYFPKDRDEMRVSLYVRRDNESAIRCYTKLGFRQTGQVKVLRLARDYYMFPKRII
ncbi:MAG: GNAT family N-acetyltransferase [Clostridium sp.]|nr:GNAT family N-acetyltransferase [Acetatifactor muris]MCM1527316.1 GNAT family N-acetyltransferase [Bacteroides sp.]MCM1563595.1 GNAT family N-acetyltransferase [Clostridium sp.]